MAGGEQQWEQHNRDEATARKEQQASAGPDHGPVAGPGLYGDHATNIYVREAVLDERERCARQAAMWVSDNAALETLGATSGRDRELAKAVGNAIAAAIRAGGEPE